TERDLRLADVTASVGEGLLRAQVSLNLSEPDRSWFNLALYRVEMTRLLAAWPGLAGWIEGPIEAHVRGNLGREWSGAGQVLLARGKVAGVEVYDWRFPLDFSLVPSRGRGRVEVRESHGQAAGGRILGQAAWSWGGGTRLDGHLRFHGVQLA